MLRFVLPNRQEDVQDLYETLMGRGEAALDLFVLGDGAGIVMQIFAGGELFSRYKEVNTCFAAYVSCQNLLDALIEVLKTEKSIARADAEGGGFGPIVFTIKEDKLHMKLDIKKDPLHSDEIVNLVQAMEEFIRGTNDVLNVFGEALDRAIENNYVDQSKKEKLMDKYFYKDWPSLEKEWANYKKKHGITEIQVKKILAEEEAKFNALKKKKEVVGKEPWWKVWG